VLPGAQHAFDALVTVRTHHVAHAIHRFAEWVRAGRHGAATPPATPQSDVAANLG